MEHAEHVDVEQTLERLGIDLLHRSVAGDTGVGHHDVDTAEPFDRRVGRGLHRSEVTHIGDGGRDVLTEGVGVRLQGVGIDVDEHQLGALAVQAARNLGSDTGSAARDENDFPAE